MAGVIGAASLKRCWNNNRIRYKNISFPNAKLLEKFNSDKLKTFHLKQTRMNALMGGFVMILSKLWRLYEADKLLSLRTAFTQLKGRIVMEGC